MGSVIQGSTHVVVSWIHLQLDLQTASKSFAPFREFKLQFVFDFQFGET